MKLVSTAELEINAECFDAIRLRQIPPPVLIAREFHRMRLVEVISGVRTGRWMHFRIELDYHDISIRIPSRNPTGWWYIRDSEEWLVYTKRLEEEASVG